MSFGMWLVASKKVYEFVENERCYNFHIIEGFPWNEPYNQVLISWSSKYLTNVVVSVSVCLKILEISSENPLRGISLRICQIE